MTKKTYGRVGDLAVLDGDIEVDADEDALSLEVEIGDREFVGERHGRWKDDWRRWVISPISLFIGAILTFPFW